MADLNWDFLPESIELEALMTRARESWPTIGWVAAWEAQSYLATLTLVTLLTLVSFWAALAVMVTWSMIASQVYPVARKRGLPDLLEHKPACKNSRRCVTTSALNVGALVARVWITGLQSF